MKNTLFFGNGINRLTENSISWDDLLEQIKGKNKFHNGELPFTMIYERILLERKFEKINNIEYSIKREISEQLLKQETNIFYNKIINLEFDNYLTTNYEYTFENTLNKDFFYGNPKINGALIVSNKSENIYSIRRHSKFSWGKQNLKLWQIHGEISNPKSIMIGLDHYGGSVSKINDYVKGNYRIVKNEKSIRIKSIKEKIETGKYDDISWIDLLFNSNVHIIGFGLDYSEIDLWWLLNKRARLMKEMNIKNQITLYSDKIKPEKKKLFNSLNVRVIEVEVLNHNYNNQYEEIIELINNRR